MMGIKGHSVLILLSSFVCCSCSSSLLDDGGGSDISGIPQHINAPGEKVVLVDPSSHRWGAYESDGSLVRSGLASAGSDYCKDLDEPCHTEVGTFRIRSLGGPDCISHAFPLPNGGAPMPYCMYFTEEQALHGVPESELGEANLSHGCVRMHVGDAAWLRYNFVNVGTKVVVEPY